MLFLGAKFHMLKYSLWLFSIELVGLSGFPCFLMFWICELLNIKKFACSSKSQLYHVHLFQSIHSWYLFWFVYSFEKAQLWEAEYTNNVQISYQNRTLIFLENKQFFFEYVKIVRTKLVLISPTIFSSSQV